MRLETIIGRLPAQTVGHFIYLLGLDAQEEADEKGRERIAGELAKRLASAQELGRAAGRFKPWVRQVLKSAVRRFGSVPFEQPALEKAALEEGLSGAYVKAALSVLRRQGILFGLRKSWGEELYLLPEDTLPVWQRLLFPGGLQPASETAVAEGEPFGNTGIAAYDLLLVLQATARGGIKATRQGAWPKPVLRKLESGLMVQDEDLQSSGVRSMPEGAYGPAAAVVLDLAIRTGLLALQGDRWTIRSNREMEWLAKPMSAVQRDLYKLWTAAVRSGEPWEAHAEAALEQAVPGSWYRLDVLFEWMQDCGMINRIAGSVMQHFLETRLLPMQALGWIRLSRLPGGALAFQLPFPLTDSDCDAPDSYSGMIVQPDLEIIIPPYPPLALLWNIMLWCDPVSRGEVSVYRLTRDSVTRGAEWGVTAEAMAETLSRFSCVPVDGHVTDTIREWAGRHRAWIRSGVTLLTLEDPAIRGYLEAREELRPLLGVRIGEGVYAVEPHMAERLSRELNRLGVVTLREKEGLLEEAADGSQGDSEICPPPVVVPRVQELPFTPAPLGGKDSEEDWKDIPAAWWKSPAAYHPSTQKDIIRHAIDRKVSVRLVDGGGTDWELIPLSIQESHEQWSIVGVRGGERITVPSSDWRQLRLIIPGVSD